MGGSVPGPHPLTLIYHFSVSEKVPFSYTFYWQIVSLSQTVCIPLNCCKDTVFKTWINPKPARFLDIFTALLGLLKTEMTAFPTLSYTLTNVIPTLWYTWSLKKLPLRAELPRIGHNREYTPLLAGRLRSRLLRPRAFNASAPRLYFVVNTGTQISCK